MSPAGHLYLYSGTETEEGVSLGAAEHIQGLFADGNDRGLLRLGISSISEVLPPSLAFWQHYAKIFMTHVCKLSGFDTLSSETLKRISPPTAEFEDFLEKAPFMRGGEYLNLDRMTDLWGSLSQALVQELSSYKGHLQDYLAAFNPSWNNVGRVCFHLAENKSDLDSPFAFLATYTTRLSGEKDVKHLPLGRALREYEGDSTQLLSLLLPVQRAAEKSSFIKHLVDTGSIFQPLSWTAREAYQFLKALLLIEEAGVIVRVPNWWNAKKPPRPQITISVGNAKASAVGLDALLDFDVGFSLPQGERLTTQELESILNAQGQLVQIKGQWVEVDREKLSQVLSHWKDIERDVKKEGLSFSEGLRLLAGASGQTITDVNSESIAAWSTVVEGSWLKETLKHLRSPEQTDEGSLGLTTQILQDHLHASLRPYQQAGVQWLWWLYNLRLGGCLADDMGLGKTIQVLALLLLIKYHSSEEKKGPSLLVLPASLLGNWQAEIRKFAPDLNFEILHSSVSNSGKTKTVPDFSQTDLVMTTYAYVSRLPWLSQISWNVVILDEAQAIKNPSAKQTQAIKKLPSRVRFVLTGTPVENRLLDLWSLFDFVAPGLLGSSSVFSSYGKKIRQKSQNDQEDGRFFSAVRHLVSPYILRRLKSDKKIIQDLPDKTEINAYCSLTKQQAALYQHAVHELERHLEQGVEGIQRRGLVLSYLTRFKQICNHPSQWLGHGQYEETESGKFLRLKEICEEIASKQEKVLIFSQFREIISPLSGFLSNVFGQEGLSLHGQTPVKERSKMVEAFQQEEKFPFFILSLKAGGTGLNLTQASHVIHFDRWWNPAVENQATDRAYRIGQKKNVLVHKFICQGTIEEKIDTLISSKKDLSDELLAGGDAVLTELSDKELLETITLDIHRALGESA